MWGIACGWGGCPPSHIEMGNSADVNCCHGDKATLSLPSPWKPGGSICTSIRPLLLKGGPFGRGQLIRYLREKAVIQTSFSGSLLIAQAQRLRLGTRRSSIRVSGQLYP